MKYLDGYPELDLLSRSLSFSSSSLRVSTRIEAYSCKPIARERKLFKTLEQDMVHDLALSTSISPPEHHSGLLSSAFGPLDKRDSRKTLWQLIATLNLAFPDHDFSRLSAEEFVKEDSAKTVLFALSSALAHLRSNADNAASNTMTMAGVAGSTTNTGTRTSQQQASSRQDIPERPSSKAENAKTSQTTASSARAKNSKTGQTNPSSHAKLIGQLRNDLDGTFDLPANPLLRQILDPIIRLNDCEVFSYTPDLDSDPHAYQSEDEDFSQDMDEDEEDQDGEGFMQLDDLDSEQMAWDMDDVETPSVPSTPASTSATFSPISTSLQSVVKGLQASGKKARSLQRKKSQGSLSNRGTVIRAGASFEPHTSAAQQNSIFQGLASDRRKDASSAIAADRWLDQEAEDVDDAEDNGGLLWSSNYFFYNRKMKRILFVSCWGRKIGQHFSPTSAILARGLNNPLHAHKQNISRFDAVLGRRGFQADSLLPSRGERHKPFAPARQQSFSGLSSSAPPSFSAPPPIANAAAVFKPPDDKRSAGDSGSSSPVQQPPTTSGIALTKDRPLLPDVLPSPGVSSSGYGGGDKSQSSTPNRSAKRPNKRRAGSGGPAGRTASTPGRRKRVARK